METIDIFHAQTGRLIRDDNSIVNFADLLSSKNGVLVQDLIREATDAGSIFSISQHTSLNDGDSIIFIGKTGDKEVIFSGFTVGASQGDLLLELIENPTATLGTQINGFCKNRIVKATSDLKTYSGTITGGTVIFSVKNPLAGQGAFVSSSSSGIDAGWILEKNSTYAIRIKNEASSDTKLFVIFNWVEI